LNSSSYSSYEAGPGDLVIQSGPDEQPCASFADSASNEQPYSYVPSDSYVDANARRYASTPQMNDVSSTPPLPQPSPSMYAYLASPINNPSSAVRLTTTKPQMATISENSDSINPPHTLSVSHPNGQYQNSGDFWRTSPSYDKGISSYPHPQDPQAGGPVVLENRIPQYQNNGFETPMNGSLAHPPPQLPSHHVHSNSNSGLLPAAGIQPAKSSSSLISHSSNGSFSYPMDPGSPAFNAMFANSHRRNLSHGLRGEYSMSNVTMDDLDSHFGNV